MSKQVVAKFYVNAVREQHGTEEVHLAPVTADTPENKAFWDATPWGDIHMGISNPGAHGFFQSGKSYRVTFEEAE